MRSESWGYGPIRGRHYHTHDGQEVEGDHQGLGQGAVEGNEGQVLSLRPVLGVDCEHLGSLVLMMD